MRKEDHPLYFRRLRTAARSRGAGFCRSAIVVMENREGRGEGSMARGYLEIWWWVCLLCGCGWCGCSDGGDVEVEVDVVKHGARADVGLMVGDGAGDVVVQG